MFWIEKNGILGFFSLVVKFDATMPLVIGINNELNVIVSSMQLAKYLP